MKKLIAVVGICMLAYILPAAAENSTATASGTNATCAKGGKKHCDPAQIVAKIDEHIKKLEQLMEEVAKVKAQGVVVAGVAGGGAAAADGGSAGGDASGAPSVGGEPEDGFGLGSNPFADSTW